MELSSSTGSLDRIDTTLLACLQDDGRITNVELARRVNLSPAATHVRVKRLEDEGFVKRYVALLDQQKLGFDMTCFISVGLRVHQHSELEAFHAEIESITAILECHVGNGEFDYLLRAVVRSRAHLQALVVNRITPMHGVSRVHTSIALSEVKSTTVLPLPTDVDREC